VVSKLGDVNSVTSNFINESMFVIDSAGPIPRKGMLERFWLPDPLKWITFRVLNKRVHSTKNFFISFLPKQIIIPSVIGEN